MKNQLFAILALAWIAGTHQAAAQATRFFRISGPAATAITAFQPDGTLVWSNAQPGATYTIQSVSSGPGDGTNWTDYVQIPTTSELNTNRLIDFNPPTNMALIPAGSFTMGDTFDDGEDAGGHAALPLHTVYVSAFYMDKFEVTATLWFAVRTWAITNGYSFNNVGSFKAANHPVQTVSWYDVVKWCNARSQKEGRTPAYYTDAALTQVYKTGQVAPYVNWNAGYRLPTEAEWEKAARGGPSGHRFPWSDVDTITHSRANYNSSASYAFDVSPTRGLHPTFDDGIPPRTSPVGYFAPNGYGLYDMAGNVFEMCWDWDGEYSSASQSDPRGPASGAFRGQRGGSFGSQNGQYRVAYRNFINDPSSTFNSRGFRSVLPSSQP